MGLSPFKEEKEIINEDGEIVNFRILRRVTNSGIEKCIGRIVNESKMACGSGFLLNIPQKKMKVFITNNHVIDQNFLDKEDFFFFSIEDGREKNNFREIKIDLKMPRIKYTNKEIDFTIIEIISQDNISDFLEIDDDITKDYKKQQIFLTQFPSGAELQISLGKILGKNDKYFLYDAGTKGGSSGSPLLLFDKLKVIGLHKGSINPKKKKDKINLGIPISIILDKILNDISSQDNSEFKINDISGSIFNINIFIVDQFNRMVTISVKPSETIKNIKKKIQNKTDCSFIHLVYNGEILEDENTLEDYDIKNGGVLTFIGKFNNFDL